MDMRSMLGTIMSDDAVAGISKSTNVSEKSVQSILSAALPSLLSGAQQQSQASDTAESFAGALTQHASSDTSNLASFLGGVDLSDGAKIVSHLLGGSNTAVVSQAAQQSGASAQETASVLAAAAPLLMSLLGKETASQQSANSGLGVGQIMGSLLGSGSVGSLLGGLLGGSAKPSSSGKKDDKDGGLLDGLLGLLK